MTKQYEETGVSKETCVFRDALEAVTTSLHLMNYSDDEHQRLRPVIKQALQDKIVQNNRCSSCEDGGWQDISTAPKDGSKILVYNGVNEGYYTGNGQIGTASHGVDGFGNKNKWCAWDCCDGVTSYEPTHWMPIPQPPAESVTNVAPKETV